MVALVVAAIAVKLADASAQHTGFRIIGFAMICLAIVADRKPRNNQEEVRHS